MRKFQDAYKDAVNELPKYHMDVENVLEGEKHVGSVMRSTGQRTHNRYLKLAATAAALFLLCGVGTATAMNYQKSKITVGNTGYSVTSPGVQVVSEDLMTVDISDAEGTDASTYSWMRSKETEALVEDAEETAVTEADSAVVATAAYESVEVLEAEKSSEPVTYDSIEEFRANEDIVVAIPDSELLGIEFEVQYIHVMETAYLTDLVVMLQSGEQRFMLKQSDTRNVKQYASSTVYMGETVNERKLINSQGLTYVLFDTMEEGGITSTHAVISVNGRDLSMDFSGYEQETVENVLTQLDLSIYFQD